MNWPVWAIRSCGCPPRPCCNGCSRPNGICVFPRNAAPLDTFACVILDDLGYIQQDRDEMEVLFTFFSERYERKSLMLSTNLVFSQWERIFKHPMTALAAIDRIVHHSVILDMMEVESYRATEATILQQAQQNRTEAANVK